MRRAMNGDGVMLKRLFRRLLGLLIFAVVIFVIIGVARFFAHRYRPGSIIVLQLNGPLLERGSYSIPGLGQAHQAALNEIRRALRGAENDPRITGLAVKILDPDMELAQATGIERLDYRIRPTRQMDHSLSGNRGGIRLRQPPLPGGECGQRSLDDASRGNESTRG